MLRSYYKKVESFLVLATLGLGHAACMPGQFNELNKSTSSAAIELKAGKKIQLIDQDNYFFDLEPGKVLVSFEVNWFGPSKVFLTNQGNRATFLVDKNLLTQTSGELKISHKTSGQPVDLFIQLEAQVKGRTYTFREDLQPESDDNCVQDFGGNFACGSMVRYTTAGYYRDLVAQVTRAVAVEVTDDTGKTLGNLHMSVVTNNEILESESVSQSEYMSSL